MHCASSLSARLHVRGRDGTGPTLRSLPWSGTPVAPRNATRQVPYSVTACVEDKSASSHRAASRNRCSEDPKTEQALRREVSRPTLYESGCSLGRNPVTRITLTQSCHKCGYDDQYTQRCHYTCAHFLKATCSSVQKTPPRVRSSARLHPVLS